MTHVSMYGEAESALEGLSSIGTEGLGSMEPAHLAMPMAIIGDAMRLGIRIPHNFVEWMRDLPIAVIASMITSITEEVPLWLFPTGKCNDDLFAFSIRRRDQAESVRICLARLSLAQDLPLADIPSYLVLSEAIRAFDKRLAESGLSRREARRMLEARAELKSSHDWTSVLRD